MAPQNPYRCEVSWFEEAWDVELKSMQPKYFTRVFENPCEALKELKARNANFGVLDGDRVIPALEAQCESYRNLVNSAVPPPEKHQPSQTTVVTTDNADQPPVAEDSPG